MAFMPFVLGSDPFATGLPSSTVETSTPSSGIFGQIGSAAKSLYGFTFPGVIQNAIGADSIGGTLGKLTSADTWQRVGFVVMGLLFIGVALFMLANKTTLVQTVQQGATRIAA